MSHVRGSEEIVNQALISHERMFPVLNKMGRIWEANYKTPLIDIFTQIFSEFKVPKNDLELTQILDEYIDKHEVR